MSLGREVGLGQTGIVLDGDPAISSPKSGQGPQFSAHVYCGQTAGWIKVALGMEVGLCPGHIVLDGDPAPPPQKGTQPPIFGPYLLWPNGWMDHDATWYGDRPRPRRHGTQPPMQWHSSSNFRITSVVAKRLDAS